MTAPPREELELVKRLLRPWQALCSPVFFHFERLPADRPLLFVGNHSLYAFLDVPHLFVKLWEDHDIFLRTLGDHAHFNVPLWRELLERWGVVDGTPENCAALFEAGESVLVFPGGAREVAKRKGERYQLVWKQRLGFARMAIRYQATIVPFAAIGAEDAWDIVYDADELLRSPVGPLVEGIYQTLGVARDSVFPLAKGIGPTMFPKPERLYFSIGQPIRVDQWAGLADDEGACWALRQQTEAAVRAELDFLMQEREWDIDRSFGSRLLRRLTRTRR